MNACSRKEKDCEGPECRFQGPACTTCERDLTSKGGRSGVQGPAGTPALRSGLRGQICTAWPHGLSMQGSFMGNDGSTMCVQVRQQPDRGALCVRDFLCSPPFCFSPLLRGSEFIYCSPRAVRQLQQPRPATAATPSGLQTQAPGHPGTRHGNTPGMPHKRAEQDKGTTRH